MNYLPVILGDLLLACMVFYGVLKSINFFSRNHRRMPAKSRVFPKLTDTQKPHQEQMDLK